MKSHSCKYCVHRSKCDCTGPEDIAARVCGWFGFKKRGQLPTGNTRYSCGIQWNGEDGTAHVSMVAPIFEVMEGPEIHTIIHRNMSDWAKMVGKGKAA